MKNQRHKRKEYFTVLFISNTDRENKQFHISLFFLRLLLVLFLAICIALGGLIYLTISFRINETSASSQLEKQKLITQQLKEETETLKKSIKDNTDKTEAADEKAAQTPSPTATPQNDDPSFPSRYPSKGSNVIKSRYSPEQQYLAITASNGCSIVAAGDGTVTSVRSDETYKHIIEIQHASGYTTRYLCMQDADLKVTEGAQVQAGTILIAVTADNTEFHYQVIYNNDAIDPMEIIKAEG